MESEELKLCVECKYETIVLRLFHPDIHGCWYEKLRDPVDGKELYRKCSGARSEEGHCGPGGKHWEAKD